jgi:putative CocE/NonD family hydrolase
LNPPLRRTAPVLWLLLSLFVLRVLGQLAVVLGVAGFLPPMEEWYSGLLPYRFLLPAQILIVLVLGKVCLDLTRGRGFFAKPRRRFANGLLVFGFVYLAVMVLRYVARMSLYPLERWTGGSIPTFLHWVLATFLLVLGTDYRRRTADETSPASRWPLRLVRWAGGALVAAGISAWLFFLLSPTLLARTLGMRAAQYAVRSERETLVTSDGVPLVSMVYHPQRAPSPPTILIRIALPATPKNRFFASTVGRLWAERGYTTVIQIARGRKPSGGLHYPLRGEREDGIETLAWIERKPWFHGRLAMWGGSSSGHAEWAVSDQRDRGPRALVVWLASSDFHGMFYPGGALSLQSALFWALRSRGEKDDPPTRETLERGYAGFPLREADDRAEENVRFFDDWVDHPQPDDYWSEIDGRDRPRKLVAPALLLAGWYDPFLPTQLEDHRRILREAAPAVAAETRLVIGPWAHAETVTLPGGVRPRNFRLESLASSVDWFDRHLGGSAGVARPSFPPVRIFVMGRNAWRDEEAWPLARAVPTLFFLRSGGTANSSAGDGRLAREAPNEDDPADSYVYDPRRPVPSAGGAMLGPGNGVARQNDVEKRPDVLVYTASVLEEDLEVTGPARLVIHVSTTAPETDFTAKLVDVHPSGDTYNVSEGILRRKYGSESPATEIEVELWPTSFVFARGHRLRLEVSSSSYPRFDRNPNTGRAIPTETRPIPARQTVHHGRSMPSRLILPVIPATRRP